VWRGEREVDALSQIIGPTVMQPPYWEKGREGGLISTLASLSATFACSCRISGCHNVYRRWTTTQLTRPPKTHGQMAASTEGEVQIFKMAVSTGGCSGVFWRGDPNTGGSPPDNSDWPKVCLPSLTTLSLSLDLCRLYRCDERCLVYPLSHWTATLPRMSAERCSAQGDHPHGEGGTTPPGP
jgi:hypothetical protein